MRVYIIIKSSKINISIKLGQHIKICIQILLNILFKNLNNNLFLKKVYETAF